MWAEALGDYRPAHELRDGKCLEELFLFWDKSIPGVGVDAVEEVGLFVIVGSEKDVVDYSLKDLHMISNEGREGLVVRQ